MALTSTIPAGVVSALKGGGHADSAPTATLVRDAFAEAVNVRGVAVNNASPAAAVFLQMFADNGPTLGTDWADVCIPVPASALLAVFVVGTSGLVFSPSLTYCLTDASHGSSMTAGTRNVFIASEAP